jgi:hypothetical protein
MLTKLRCRRSIVTLAASITLAPTLSGCFANRTEIIQQAENFSESLAIGSTTLREYYQGLNTLDRESFKLVLSLNKDCDLKPRYNQDDCKYFRDSLGDSSKPYTSPLEETSYISGEALNSRLKLLNLLSVYAKTLSTLASDGSPDQFKTSMSNLQAAGISLANKIKETSDGSPTVQSGYLTPLSQIIGILGKIYLNESKWRQIRESVEEAAPKVDLILATLQDDIAIAENAYRVKAIRNAAAINKYYTDNRTAITLQERRDLLDSYENYNTMRLVLRQKVNSDGSITSKAVGNLITPLRSAHMKLSTLSSTQDYDLIAEIKALLDVYDTEIQEIRSVIAILK